MEYRISKIKNCKLRLNVSAGSLNRTGSALVLVVVLTVLLAAIGVMFLMMSRISEMSTGSIGDDMQLRCGVNIVVNRIKDVLFQDLLGNDPNLLNGNGDSNGSQDEYWDYPGDDDPWLASLEPVVFDNNGTSSDPTDDTFSWPHITDLYDNNFGLPDDGTTFYDPGYDPVTWPYSNSDYEVSPDDVIASKLFLDDERVYSFDTDGVKWFTGARADADGDGVADSRWIKLPGISGSSGEPVYAAVRIIDNGGMININTAYRNPTGVGDWDGSQLSHVNLAGIEASGDFSGGRDYTDIQELRYGSVALPDLETHYSYISDTQYETEVALRLLNPVPNYSPFDLFDELELRNRFFLSSLVDPACSFAWPVTFDPDPSSVGREIPYSPDKSNDYLYNWYLKATSPQYNYSSSSYNGLCNRRHLSTTLNLDRMLLPSKRSYDNMPQVLKTTWNSWSDWNSPYPENWLRRPIALKKYIVDTSDAALDPLLLPKIEPLAAAIWLSLPNDAKIQARFGTDYSREELAYQYAVNIADCQDEKSDITEGPVSFTTNTTLFTAGEKTYIGLEDINGLERDTLCISKLGYVEVNIASPAPTDPPNGKYFAVELFNPDDTTEKSAVDMRDYKICIIRGYDLIGLYSLDDFLPLGAINASTGTGTGDVGVYVITESDASVGEARSALGATAVAGVLNNSVVNFLDGDKVVILKYSSIIMPVDYITIPPATISWATFNVSKVKSRRHVLSGTRFLLPASKNGSYSPWTGASAIELGQDVDPADLEIPTLAGLNKVHLTQSGRPVRNVAEIENIPAVGYSYEYGFVAGQPPKRICQTLMKGIVDSCETIKTADPSADREFGVEMGSFGKVRLDYQDYHKLTRYLSYFDISTDGVDNDGINDIDGPREVSIAGRININTAPWFVLVQLPWMTYQTSSDPLVTDVLDRVEAVIDYRDGASGPYKKIVDLLKIDQMKSLANDADNNLNSDSPIKGPDFTDDGVVDDFEELHVIFHRISNLVTVRSDMFTAYILVRLGVDGPQKRMIAIFDRSGVFSRDDRVKLVALHPIPDPR